MNIILTEIFVLLIVLCFVIYLTRRDKKIYDERVKRMKQQIDEEIQYSKQMLDESFILKDMMTLRKEMEELRNLITNMQQMIVHHKRSKKKSLNKKQQNENQ